MIEIWKIIEEYPDYKASNLGRIKSLKFRKEKILEQCLDSRGYYIVSLCKNNKSKTKLVHLLVLESFNRKLEKNECVHHINENCKDNNIDNLKIMNLSEHQSFHNYKEKSPHFGTHRSNETKLKISRKNKGENHPFFGVKRPGEKSGNHKLEEKEVVQINMLFKLGFKNKEISIIYNVSPETISSIKNKRSWNHIKMEII